MDLVPQTFANQTVLSLQSRMLQHSKHKAVQEGNARTLNAQC